MKVILCTVKIPYQRGNKTNLRVIQQYPEAIIWSKSPISGEIKQTDS